MSWFHELYPDLQAEGGLRAALQSRLTGVVLALPFHDPPAPADGYSTGASAGERSIHVALGCEERVFVGEFWEAGVCLGAYSTASVDDVAELFERWLTRGELASRLTGSATLEVAPRRWAAAHERGPEAHVEFWWDELLRDPRDAVRTMAEAAAQVPVLRGLRPYTSHDVLRFSRSTGYPFSPDCPSITPMRDGSYAVEDASGRRVGTGSAAEAARLAAAILPPGTGPAMRGPWPE